MKTYVSILAVSVLLFASCNTPQGAASAYKDDVYFSSKDAAAEKEEARLQDEREKAEQAKREAEEAAMAQNKRNNTTEDYYRSDKETDGNGNTTINNYYNEPFDYDDYYDYEYATRIRHFHNNCGSYGYYDNYYTNSYWYTGNPYNYGTSVYMGYNFWGPAYVTYSYYPSYMWYSNYGWGGGYYDPWGSPYGYNPYYGYGYNPYMNGYANGYNNGYWNGYYNGYYNNYYFNSYDNNSYYYGPRGTQGSNGRVSAQPSLAHRYMDAIEQETQKPFEATLGRDNNPNLQATTVNDYMTKPVYIDNSHSGKPVINGPVNPNYKPDNNYSKPTDARPTYSDKPIHNSDSFDKPSHQNNSFDKPITDDNDYYSRPAEKPSKFDPPVNDKPVYNNRPSERPHHESKPVEQPIYNQPKPSFENKPSESKPTPSTSPAPRSNSNRETGSSPRRR